MISWWLELSVNLIWSRWPRKRVLSQDCLIRVVCGEFSGLHWGEKTNPLWVGDATGRGLGQYKNGGSKCGYWCACVTTLYCSCNVASGFRFPPLSLLLSDGCNLELWARQILPLAAFFRVFDHCKSSMEESVWALFMFFKRTFINQGESPC